MNQRPLKALALLVILSGLVACDPEHRKKCEWNLVPNLRADAKAHAGFIPVCARNPKVNKEDCRLQTTLSFATKVEKKTFKYVDLKVKNLGLPRTIDEIEFCTPD